MAAQATVALGEEAAAENGCSLGMTASAGGAFVLLGLLQPQRWLTQLPPIDTSQHTAAIIIPVLNEAGGIVATLQQLRQLQPQPAEIIVVDGGSSDNTVQLARRSGLATRVLRSGRGRAVQMNAGAEAAAADMLCFLHADTQPPKDLVAVMRRELADPQKVLAGFVPSIEVPRRRLWLLSAHNFASSYYAPLLFRPLSYLRGLRALFGDQTLFCRARDFRAVGGFDPRLSIMEDTDLCVRMHMAGPRQQQRRHGAQFQKQRKPSAQPWQQHSGCSSSSSSSSSSRSDGPSRQHPGPGSSSSSSSSSSVLDPPLAALAGAAAALHAWQQPRGRVVQVLDRVSVTSGRRLAAWGTLRATYIHFRVATCWYFGGSPEQLRELYMRLYTDSFR
ncbi:hypothetical protein OEZ85_002806 [Tetradesmus obliquus]|uniref:Glycosyltransferase 2-like domain-containing protein n=1 Tax=Tetradesmus obliquus TaxID=3088 RepID=A0ABY8TYP0_TETOB|nr:hypothetical protein OEZ85_002806 [Tetradesmus obliquus]